MSDKTPEFVYDEDNLEPIVLQGENGEEVEFVEIAGIVLENKVYSILQPVDLPDDMAEDEALVFEVTQDPTDEDADIFELVTDEDTMGKVFDEYYRLCDEADEAESEG